MVIMIAIMYTIYFNILDHHYRYHIKHHYFLYHITFHIGTYLRIYQFTEHFDFSVPPADPKLQIEKWDYPKSDWLVIL
jgi:hypothetical protein